MLQNGKFGRRKGGRKGEVEEENLSVAQKYCRSTYRYEYEGGDGSRVYC